jgi:putative transposase
VSESRRRKEETPIWQRRFWEHTIRDEQDLNRHIDYIHYNPVKHGLVMRVAEWQWSSFHRYVKEGMYDPLWGEGCTPLWGDMQVGE